MTPSRHRLIHKIQGALRFSRALQLVWHSSPKWMMDRIVLLVVQSTLLLLSLYLMKVIVDVVSTVMASVKKRSSL